MLLAQTKTNSYDFFGTGSVVQKDKLSLSATQITGFVENTYLIIFIRCAEYIQQRIKIAFTLPL